MNQRYAVPLLRSWRQAWARLSPNGQGAVFMTGAAAVFAVLTVILKLLGQTYHPLQMTFLIQLGPLLLLVPSAVVQGVPLIPRARASVHVIRALCGYSGFACFLISIQYLTLADAVAISFATPLFMVVWAIAFLGERLRPLRALATLAGFGGVLVMMRPGQGAFEWAALAALAGCMFGATAMTLVKKLTLHDDNRALLVSFAIVSVAAGLGPALYFWRSPLLIDLASFAVVGIAGLAGQYCLIRAYRVADATAVAPFDYSRLIISTALGFLIFDEVPDGWTLAGAAIIVASTYTIARYTGGR